MAGWLGLWIFMPGPAEVAPPPPAPSHEAGDEIPTWVNLRFAHRPDSFSLHLDDRELWSVTEPAFNDPDTELDLAPADAARLILKANWPDREEATAVTLILEPEGLPTREATLWVTGDADHAFPFHDPEVAP